MEKPALHLPQPRLWTREEYERAGATGLLRPDENLELIEGAIVQKMVQGALHVTGVQLVQHALSDIFRDSHHLRIQMPLALGATNEPEPDVAVVAGAFMDYVSAHPEMAVLVVEVADRSLAIDRTIKAGLYARCGIPEYWILNLVDRLLEVYREPGTQPEQPVGHQYRNVQRLSCDQTVFCLAAPEHIIRVSDLLP